MINSLKQQQGLAVVELALATSILLFLVLITGEFGRLFYQYNELTKSIGPSARYLSEHARNAAGVFAITDADKAIAKNLVVFGGPLDNGSARFPNLSTSDVSVSNDSNHVTVSVEWKYQSLFGGSIPSFQFSKDDINTNNLVLKASLTMRVLN